MATPGVDSNTPNAVLANDVNKKKTRLNPTRRKAAAKANIDDPKTTLENATATISAVTSQPSEQVNKTNAQPIQTKQVKRQPSKPVTLPRQNSEPATLPKQKTGALPSNPKPSLQRTITTPENATKSKTTALALKGPALVTGGLVGCAAGAAILLGVGIWYDFSGAESAIMTARAAKLCVDNLTDELVSSLKAGTYSSDEAIDVLRRTTLAYASTIPEGAPFVEKVFREIDMVRKQRGREIDKVVAETYSELAQAGVKGASEKEMRSIVVGQLMKLSRFAGQATQDVVARNPKLKPVKEEVRKGLQGPPKTKTPTIRVNMAVRQKQGV